MENGGTILVMAGAREAHGVISGLRARGRRVIARLAEPERMFDTLPVPTRVGTFADEGAFAQWCEENCVTCVIDAGHAFDAGISDQAARGCAASGMRYVRLLRPCWHARRQDRWAEYASVSEAVRNVSRTARVFCNTGRASLPDCADFAGEVLYMRQTQKQTDQPPFPFVEYILGTPPFAQAAEEDLFRRLRITRLMCRNVGGSASKSKLLAARRLGLGVSMITRPDPPEGMPLVVSVAEALAWEADP